MESGIKIRRSWLGIFCLLVVGGMSSQSVWGQYAGGDGSAEFPFEIAEPNQLIYMSQHPEHWGFNFVLTADIDLSGYTFTTALIAPDTLSVDNFQGTDFNGIFDGADHSIMNLTIDPNEVDNDYLGLFGYIHKGVIRNLHLKDPNVSGGNNSYYLGGITGTNDGIICNCYVTGNISGYAYIGGLVGINEGTICNCYATGSVSGNYNVGGLVGRNYYGFICNCYAMESIFGGDDSSNIGGLVGYNTYSSINNCYAAGSINVGNSPDDLGGLVGYDRHGSITNCYATGSIIPGSMLVAGGLVGSQYEGSIKGGYFLHPDDGGGPINGYGTPLYDTQMRQQSSFSGWDFIGQTIDGPSEIWQMATGGGYPELSNLSGFIPPALAGEGTTDNPYLISDPNELGIVYHYDATACYRLTADIDFSGIIWSIAPIPLFQGKFDGNHHSISHLTVTDGFYLNHRARLCGAL